MNEVEINVDDHDTATATEVAHLLATFAEMKSFVRENFTAPAKRSPWQRVLQPFRGQA
jgi:hypothetical protein